MGGVNYGELLERYPKTLTGDEKREAAAYLDSLEGEDAAPVVAAGDIFLKSGSVNGAWFWRTVLALAKNLNRAEISRWAEEGIRVCRSSRDCTLPFLKASPEVARLVDPDTFLKWIAIAAGLARFSAAEANWYFRNSGTVLGSIPVQERSLLMGRTAKILKYSWQAAASCFKAWPQITACLDYSGKEHLFGLAQRLAAEFPDDAPALFPAVPGFMAKAGAGNFDGWVNAAYLVSNGKRGVVAAYLGAAAGLADETGDDSLAEKLAQWIEWANRLAAAESTVAREFYEKTPGVLKYLEWPHLGKWADLVERVCREDSPEDAVEFVHATQELLPHLDIDRVENWVEYGLKGVKAEKRPAYFSLRAQESRDMISRLRTGLYLETVKKVLLLYCEGLTGEAVLIRNASDLPDRIHCNDRLFAALDTRRIYLPDVIRKYSDERENLRLYRVMLMHQYAHRRFGTLELSAEHLKELAGNEILARLFEYIEDNRVDYLAMNNYPGLSRDMEMLLAGEKPGNNREHGVFQFLKFALWPGLADNNGFAGAEHTTVYRQYWQRVEDNGASAGESLALARRILQLPGGRGPYHVPDNLAYRGRLRFDLIYKAVEVDEEVSADAVNGGTSAVGANRDEEIRFEETEPHSGEKALNLHSEFYLRLKQLLHKFYEDEQNPYRMVAFYDEWDRTLNDYKKDWCRVREILLKPSTGRFVTRTLAEHRGMIATLKRYFGMLRPGRFRKYGRQADGEDIDIDAVIEAMAEKEAGVSPAGGFYVRRDKRERDVAVGFLLDLSYSTDEVIAGSGKTLLDVERESVIVMAEALEVLGDKYAIYGFNSDRRDKINFYVAKDFDENYSEEVKQRFGGFQSYGMTRLGAAVRHAVFKMERVQAAIKILILLSDGRPFDFDYNSGFAEDYEQFYPEADTRVALREARMKGVNPFCITVDAKGQDYMEYIFGNVSYIIIDDVNALPTKLTETYKNLTT